MSTPQQQLAALAQSLDALRGGQVRIGEWSQQARQADALLEALPPRFTEVLLGLLDRLESSALFSEESCSFSQAGLLDNLGLWLDKARSRLDG